MKITAPLISVKRAAQPFIILFLSVMIVIAYSCQNSEEKLVGEMEGLVSTIRESQDTLSEAGWVKYDAQLEEMNQRYLQLESQLTEEQKQKYNEAKGRYSAIRLKSGINNAVDEFQKGMEEAGQQLKGMMEELGADSLE